MKRQIMVRMKNKKRKENIIFVVIGLTGIILVIVSVIILWGGKKKTDTSTYGITEMTNSEITQETEITTVTVEIETTEDMTTEGETTEVITTEIFEREISNSQSSKELDRDQTLAAIERFCREQNPDLNNMSQDEYSFYWELTSETEQEYVVTYCSYTGSFTYFHVNKATGEVMTMEYVPGITDGEVPGAEEFQIWDYIG